ncbi:MAG: hypothetical protein ABF289_07220 [Clostridiales bacterium]
MFRTFALLTNKALFRKKYNCIIIAFYMFIFLIKVNDNVVPLLVYTFFINTLIVYFIVGTDMTADSVFKTTNVNLTGILPVSRKEFIINKYLVNNISLIIVILFSTIIYRFIHNIVYSMNYIIMMFFIILILNSITILLLSYIKNNFLGSNIFNIICICSFIIVGFMVEFLLKDVTYSNYISIILIVVAIVFNLIILKIHLNLSKKVDFKYI